MSQRRSAVELSVSTHFRKHRVSLSALGDQDRCTNVVSVLVGAAKLRGFVDWPAICHYRSDFSVEAGETTVNHLLLPESFPSFFQYTHLLGIGCSQSIL